MTGDGYAREGNAYDVRYWTTSQRRSWSLGILGAAVVLILAGIAAWYLMSTPDTVLWTLFGVGLVLLVLLLALIALRAPSPGEAGPRYGPSAPANAAPQAAEESWGEAPAAHGGDVLTLRCGQCATLFDLADTGQRPLYHTCPGCGAQGVLRTPPAAPEPAPAPEAPSEWGSPVPEETAAPVPAPTVKKIKLRCGGCKNIFSVEDNGSRPLRHRCPHCNRAGELR